MIVLNSYLIPPRQDSFAKRVVGQAYDEDKKEFLDFYVDLMQVELNMLYKGDISLIEILDNCIVGKPNHSIEKTKPEDIETLLKLEKVKFLLKPYLREDILNNLGI